MSVKISGSPTNEARFRTLKTPGRERNRRYRQVYRKPEASESIERGEIKLKTILVVDSDVEMRSKCEAEIAAMGHLPVSVRNGLEAISAFNEVHPDLVIMELKLPDMHGFEVLQKLLNASPDTPVIIHSSYSHYRSDFMSWAAEEYIVKSGDMHDFRNAIGRILARHGSCHPA